MARPIVAANSPMQVHVEKGKRYFFCACGRSARQPFCDGSHKATDISPVEFAPEEDKQVWLCMCKQTGNPPFCDGTHKQFGPDQVGTEHGGG